VLARAQIASATTSIKPALSPNASPRNRAAAERLAQERM
jgi:hypothetical protein